MMKSEGQRARTDSNISGIYRISAADMMDTFPDHHHPYLLSHHNKKSGNPKHRIVPREMFGDYGSYGGVTVKESEGELSFLPQKYHLQPGELRLGAKHPTLPLFATPSEVPFPFKDCVSGLRFEQCQKMKDCLQRLAFHKRYPTNARAAWDPLHSAADSAMGEIIRGMKTSCETYLTENNDPALLEDISETLDCVPWLKADVELYKEVKDVKYLPNVNTDFNGGCLACVREGTSGIPPLLVHPAGPDWDQLALTSLQHKENEFVQGDHVTIVSCSSPVQQVEAQTVNNLTHCMTRGKDGCSLLKADKSEDDMPTLYHLGDQKIDSLSSICLSPFILGESLIATYNGDALLWSADRSPYYVLRDKSHRFHCPEHWRQCQYAGHPRLMTMADRTVLELFDIRTSNRSGVDLFALPSKVLHKSERIMVTLQHSRNYFYHFVGTDYSLILIDERFPGHPVLQWYHLLQSQPQYMSMANHIICNSEDDIILLGSQHPAETCAFQYKLGTIGSTTQSTCMPWRISKIKDFTKFPALSGVTHNLVVKDRFSSSLAGICALTNNTPGRGFTALQLDCHGDLFYQCYTRDVLSGEITQAAGPGSTDIVLSSEVVQHCSGWLKTLEMQTDDWFMENNSQLSNNTVDASGSFLTLSQEKYAHVLCPLCMPQTCQPLLEPQDEEHLCHVCGHKIGEASSVVQAIQEDRVVYPGSTEDDDQETMFPGSADLMTCQLPLSRILDKQWRGDNSDFNDLLFAQDKLLKEQKEERKKKVLERRKLAKEKEPKVIEQLLGIDKDHEQYSTVGSDSKGDTECSSHVGQTTPRKGMKLPSPSVSLFNTPSPSSTHKISESPCQSSHHSTASVPGFCTTPVRLSAKLDSRTCRQSELSHLSGTRSPAKSNPLWHSTSSSPHPTGSHQWKGSPVHPDMDVIDATIFSSPSQGFNFLPTSKSATTSHHKGKGKHIALSSPAKKRRKFVSGF